jgi:uncharacterized protein YdgA (DUF945 family)
LLNNSYVPNIESKPRTKDVKITVQAMKIKWSPDKSEFKHYLGKISFDEQAINDTKSSVFMNQVKAETAILKLKKKLRINYQGIMNFY